VFHDFVIFNELMHKIKQFFADNKIDYVFFKIEND